MNDFSHDAQPPTGQASRGGHSEAEPGDNSTDDPAAPPPGSFSGGVFENQAGKRHYKLYRPATTRLMAARPPWS